MAMRSRRPSTATDRSAISANSETRDEHNSDSSSVITQSTSSSLSTSSLQSADNVRNQKYADACEILTFKSFPPGVIHRLGGLVSATSVKLIENDQSRTRELWFDDLRAEIKHHALAIGCSHIIGYTEQVSIREEIIILIAYGTAAVLDLDGDLESKLAAKARHTEESPMVRPADQQVTPHTPHTPHKAQSHAHAGHRGHNNSTADDSDEHHKKPLGCRMAHASHDRQKLPYPMRFFRCGFCQKKAVPEILLTTIDIPLELDVIDGESCMIEAHICRPGSKVGMANAVAVQSVVRVPTNSDLPESKAKASGAMAEEGERKRWFGLGKGPNAGPDSKLSGEAYAAHISDALPFMHYDLHRQLLYKLSVHGMNAIFGLKYQFSIGEDMIIAVATGTAVYVTGLPTPGPLHIKRNIDVLDDEDRSFIRIQDRIMRLSNANRRRLDHAFRKKRRAMIRLREQQRQQQQQASYRGLLEIMQYKLTQQQRQQQQQQRIGPMGQRDTSISSVQHSRSASRVIGGGRSKPSIAMLGKRENPSEDAPS
ncbi:hypothetical protein GGF37_006123, partial [Kickxella alabastrina]